MKQDRNVVDIDEDETERVLTVAAAVDVAKASGMVCVRRPHPSIEGRRTSRVWEVESTTSSILALGADLVALGVERVVPPRTPASRGPRPPAHHQRRARRTRPRCSSPQHRRTPRRGPRHRERAAQILIAEVGLNMAQFPTPAHLVSWAKLSPQTIQSGPKTKVGKTGKGNRHLKGVLGEVATAAAKTDTFLGERYRRLVRRRGKQRALVRQLHALGHTVTLTPAA